MSQDGQYAAVAIHMENLAQTSHNADIAGRGKKVFKTLKDLRFVAFCHFLADVSMFCLIFIFFVKSHCSCISCKNSAE